MRPAVIREPGYSHSHYHREDAPQCGLATPAGACLWPKEPGLPWCNPHTAAFLDRMKAGGYSLEQARAYFGTLGWDAVAVECACVRYESVLGGSRIPKKEPAARKPRGL